MAEEERRAGTKRNLGLTVACVFTLLLPARLPKHGLSATGENFPISLTSPAFLQNTHPILFFFPFGVKKYEKLKIEEEQKKKGKKLVEKKMTPDKLLP